MELVCRQCETPFFHQKKGRGRWPSFCSARCVNRYYYVKRGGTQRTASNTMKCSVCRQDMWRSASSLPEGEATCRPCRRTRNEALDLNGFEFCRVCSKPLTDIQRRRGGQFCSSACGYVHVLRINPEPYESPHKRYRRYGVCRAADGQTGLVIFGPGRRQKLSLHRNADGDWTVCCRLCMNHIPIDVGQVLVQCEVCRLQTELDRPLKEVA